MNLLTTTGDGSNTLYNERIGEHYHSKHGAVQESKHVFIQAGLMPVISRSKEIKILEIGFGTGLNFLLTIQEALLHNCSIHYTSLEPFPLSIEEIESLAFNEHVPASTWALFKEIHENASRQHNISLQNIHLSLLEKTLQNYEADHLYDLIYFDAFSVRHQPELWSDEIILKTCNFLKRGGVFVTYAITGKLKRAVIAAGCTIEKLPGAPGKREMLRATKI